MPGLQFRDACTTDLEAIRELTLSAYNEYATLMPAHWHRYRQAILGTLADVKPAEQIVAEQDESLVGSVLLYPAGTVFHTSAGNPVTLAYPEIRLLAVLPAARGRGIGQALVRECIRRARFAGATTITLHTTDAMRVAMRMYERMGFVRAPELDFHPAEDLTIKGYRLDLDPSAA